MRSIHELMTIIELRVPKIHNDKYSPKFNCACLGTGRTEVNVRTTMAIFTCFRLI